MTGLDGAEVAAMALRLGFAVALYAFVALAVWSLWRSLADDRSPARSDARLRLVAALDAGEEVGRLVLLVGEGLTIGRHPENDVVVRDDGVSARHVRLHPTRDGWVVTDLGSRNGTTVNGRLLDHPARLSNGDQIGMGGLSWSFEASTQGKRPR